MDETTTKKASKKNTSKPYRMYLIVIAAILVLAVGGYFGYKYWQTKQNNPAAQEAKAAAQADAQKKDILAKLKLIMVLPEGDPVLFKVNDQETMRKQQAFFKDTMNDDVLLVFQQSSKAIIYRPSTNMIVNVGPINFDQNANSAKTPVNPTQAPTQSATTTKTSTTSKK